MGMLDELLRQLQEAADQQRNQPLPGTPRPARSPASTEPQKNFAKRALKQEVVTEAVEDVGEDPVNRLVADSAPAVVESSRRREHPLMGRLRTSGGMRDAIVLAEILKRPRC